MTIPDLPELPEHDADYLRIARYLQGRCSPVEAARIESELAVDDRMQFAAQLLSLALAAPSTSTEPDVDEGWTEITRRIATSEHPRSRFRRRLKQIAVVATAVPLLIFAWATYQSLAPVIAGHFNEHYEAPMESRRTIRLPDGSRATLEPGARLTYRASFFPRPRLLTLEGEARFQARPDATRPFEVHANGVFVIAVGTVFTVRANPWQPTVHVSVEEGVVRVGLETATTSQLVTAGNAADLTPPAASP